MFRTARIWSGWCSPLTSLKYRDPTRNKCPQTGRFPANKVMFIQNAAIQQEMESLKTGRMHFNYSNFVT